MSSDASNIHVDGSVEELGIEAPTAYADFDDVDTARSHEAPCDE